MEGEGEKFRQSPCPGSEQQPSPAPFVPCNVRNQPLLSNCKQTKSNNNKKITLKVCFHKAFWVFPQRSGELLAVLPSLQRQLSLPPSLPPSVCVCVCVLTQGDFAHTQSSPLGHRGLAASAANKTKNPKPEFSLTQVSMCSLKLNVWLTSVGVGACTASLGSQGRGRAEEGSRLCLLLLALIFSLWQR